MFNQILNLSKNVQNQNDSSASIQLFKGLNLIGQILIPTQQWNNQFTKIQSKHISQRITSHQLNKSKIYEENTSFTQKMASQVKNFTLKECKLCKKQQSNQNFKLMCKCDHIFCYSCLNAYAISKVNAQERVSCPQLQCIYQMKISSQVYKYLPEMIKLKYLQWKNINKAKQLDLSNNCLRCLQVRHSGQCQVSFSSENIESAFNYRKCYKCQKQIKIIAGAKKVSCLQCQAMFCYVCGQTWPIEGNHNCVNDQKVLLLENQVMQSSENTDKNEYCCQDSECHCFKNCGKCLNTCFYCKRCDLSICLGNFFLIPIRLIASSIVIFLYVLMLIPTTIIILGWLFSGICTGVTCFACQILDKCYGCWQALAIIGYPFIMIAGIFYALKQLFPGFYQALQIMTNFYQKTMCEMWISCGPKQCCS